MSEFEGFLFYFFGAVMLASGVGVITLRNPVYCAFLLVLSFISGAAVWLLLGAEFLAWVLVLVYVGAVMVLFLFVVMMLDLNLDRLREGFWRYLPIGLVVAVVLAAQIYLALNASSFDTEQWSTPKGAVVDKDYSHAKEMGSVLYTDYLLAFEVAAILLLVAIVAAIALTMRERKGNKYTDPAEQVKVKAAEQVSLVKIELDPEPEPEIDAEEAKDAEQAGTGKEGAG